MGLPSSPTARENLLILVKLKKLEGIKLQESEEFWILEVSFSCELEVVNCLARLLFTGGNAHV